MSYFQSILGRKFLLSSLYPTKVRFLSANCSSTCQQLSCFESSNLTNSTPLKHVCRLGKPQFLNHLLRKFLFSTSYPMPKNVISQKNSQRHFPQNRYRLPHLQTPKKTVFRILRENAFDSNLYQFAIFATLPSMSNQKPTSFLVANFLSPVRFFLSLHITYKYTNFYVF